MKKLFLVALGFIAFSSFTTDKKVEDSVLKHKVYFHCADGHMNGSFISSSSNPADWQATANMLCGL